MEVIWPSDHQAVKSANCFIAALLGVIPTGAALKAMGQQCSEPQKSKEDEMASYDRRIIIEFADRLYNRAGTVIFIYTLIGILAGGSFYPFSKTTGIILAAVFGFIGFLIGNEKAFWYKLQAQITLCQAKIEEKKIRLL